MAFSTAGGLLDAHGSVALHALNVVRTNQRRPEEVPALKCAVTMTASASRGLKARRTAVVTPLADGFLLFVKIFNQFAALDTSDQGLNNFPVRHLYRFVSVFQVADGHLVRDLLVRKRMGHRLSRGQ